MRTSFLQYLHFVSDGMQRTYPPVLLGALLSPVLLKNAPLQTEEKYFAAKTLPEIFVCFAGNK